MSGRRLLGIGCGHCYVGGTHTTSLTYPGLLEVSVTMKSITGTLSKQLEPCCWHDSGGLKIPVRCNHPRFILSTTLIWGRWTNGLINVSCQAKILCVSTILALSIIGLGIGYAYRTDDESSPLLKIAHLTPVDGDPEAECINSIDYQATFALER